MTAARTPSQIGKASRAKGARYERLITTAVRPWFPDVRRSRDNGSVTTTDTGDLTDTGPALWWSLKSDRKGDSSPPGVIGAWMAEARDKAGPARIPLLVQKRPGHTDPLASWCWMWLRDLADLTAIEAEHLTDVDGPIRMELCTALRLLASAGYAQQVQT